jgi:hypothetical protein
MEQEARLPSAKGGWFHEANHRIRKLAVTPAAATEQYCFLDQEREKTREDILAAFGILCSLA